MNIRFSIYPFVLLLTFSMSTPAAQDARLHLGQPEHMQAEYAQPNTILSRGTLPDNVYLSESFDSPDLPANWILFNLDGNTPSPTVGDFTEAWNVRPALGNAIGNSLQSTSYYVPEGQADDWVITERISIGDNTRLRWFASSEPGIPDGYEVYVSTTTQDLPGCTANPLLFSTDAESETLTQRSVNLAAAGYANQDIYLCYRNNTFNGFALQIDDIRVYTPFDNDLGLVSASRPNEYTQSTLLSANPSLTLETEVINDGLLPQSNFTVIAFILKDGQIIQELSTQSSVTLNAGETTTVTLPSYQITATGQYNVLFDVSPSDNVQDGDTGNNFLYLSDVLTVSKNTMARDTGFAYDSLGFISDNGGYLGNAYLIEKEAQLEHISFFFTNFCSGGCPLEGLTLDARILAFDEVTQLPDNIIGRSESYSIPRQDIISEEIELKFNPPVSLQPGRYLLAVRQPAGPDQTIRIDTSEKKFTTEAGWLSIPIDTDPNWRPVEFYNRYETLMIRGKFSSTDQQDMVFQNGFED